MEHWAPIRGYEGLYDVSTKGRVRSRARVVRYSLRYGGEKTMTIRPRLLRLTWHRGQTFAYLKRDGLSRTASVRTLMAEAFHQSPFGTSKPMTDSVREPATVQR